MGIDIASGVVWNTYSDIYIPGKVPLDWKRHYATSLINNSSPLGWGWFNKFFCSLSYNIEKRLFTFIDAEGSKIELHDPNGTVNQGVMIHNFGAYTELWFKDNWLTVCQWDVETGEVWRYLFQYLGGGKISPLQEIQDVTGQGLQLAYNSKGQLAGIQQKLEKRSLLLHYNSKNLIDTIEFQSSDKRTRQVMFKYQFDYKNRLVSVTDAAENCVFFDYDVNNRIIRESNKNTSIDVYKYDKQGRCVHSTGLGGYNERKFLYMEATGCTQMTNSHGDISIYNYNDNGQVVLEVNPVGAETKSKFDKFGRIIGKIDAVGNETHYKYDKLGNRVKTIDALGQETSFQYNFFHQATCFTNPAGHQWLRLYDEYNCLIETKDPDQNCYKMEYDKFGNLIKITDPLGNHINQIFSSTGTLRSATDWLGSETNYEEDGFGRLTKVIDPVNYETQYYYDVMNNLTLVEYPDRTSEKYNYDARGNLIKSTDRNGQSSHYKYAHCNRLIERTDALDRKTYFHWDTEPDQLSTVINAKAEAYHFTYGAEGLVIEEIGFDGRVLKFKYDLAGNKINSVNGLGESIDIERDELGRLTSLCLSNGEQTTLEYNSAGFISSIKNDFSESIFERDSLGRIIAENQNGHSIQRSYDAIGNQNQLDSSLGLNINYQFDANGFLSQFNANNYEPTIIERDQLGSEIQRSLHKQCNLSQSHDSMGRVLSQSVQQKQTDNSFESPKSLIERSYSYDNANLISINDQVRGKKTHIYDPTERLIEVISSKGVNETFLYDNNDNLTKTRLGDLTSELTYAQGDKLISQDTTEFYWDNHGRLIRKVEISSDGQLLEWKYEWDALDQLRIITNPKGEVWQYTYDAFGRRIEKRSPRGELTTFVWDADVVLHELAEESVTTSWIFDPHSFNPLCKLQNNNIYSIICDHLGTPTEMLDSFGNIVWKLECSSWGKPKYSNISDVDCPIRFQGQWFDEESGLHYNRFRYYDPSSARYCSQDDLRLRGGRNLYHYVLNPVMWIDPFGLCDDRDFTTRQEALDAAYDRAGIPRGQQPDLTWTVGNNPRRRGRPGYLYSEDRGAHGTYRQFETEQGSRVVAEHQRDGRSHFHAGQPKGDSSRSGVDFGWGGDPGSAERYQNVDGCHHYYYE